VRIFNQMTEVHRVIDLAELVARVTGARIELVDNPRKEALENDLAAANRSLLDLGLDPIRLEDDLLREVTEVALRYRDRCDVDKIPCRSRWAQQPVPAG
jgi:UDP-sulfoquinovose synthase